MDDKELIANLSRSLAQLSLLVGGLEEFSMRLVRGALPRLDADRLAEIKAASLRALKNANISGLAIDAEAEILRKALRDLEKLIDGAIARARQRDDFR